MTTRTVLMTCTLLIFLVAGCSGSGDMVNLRIYDLPSGKEKVVENIVVAVETFEDRRDNKERLGSRIHMRGGQTYFNFMGGNLGTGGSEAFIAFLNSRGFQASKAGSGSPDVTITAIVRTFNADAISKFMNTHLKVRAITEFHVTNHADESKVRLTIGSGGTDNEIIFDQEDMEELVNMTLQETFEKFLSTITIRDKTLRKKI